VSECFAVRVCVCVRVWAGRFTVKDRIVRERSAPIAVCVRVCVCV